MWIELFGFALLLLIVWSVVGFGAVWFFDRKHHAGLDDE